MGGECHKQEYDRGGEGSWFGHNIIHNRKEMASSRNPDFLSPSPRHRPLLRLALWQVVSSEAEHLKPIGAIVSPAVGLVAGYVEVARGLGAVTQGCFL